MFQLTTTYNRDDFTKLLTARFGVPRETVSAFFDYARGMNFYDDQSLTTGQLFEKFFPGRPDIHRLLMEPIVYANGSTLEDPALTYGIVFSNFMSKGVYTFEGGTDRLVESAVRFIPDYRNHVIDTDMFTPTTIRRFTWHDNGAVYGAPEKRLSGGTHLKNLYLCGTDQGFCGIIGAIFSGISMANQHCLVPGAGG
jgi:hypothetical protein